MKSATIYLVRHGETVGNDTKLVMDPVDDVLNDTGKLQAEKLGEKLKDVEFTSVYASPYPRTSETASIILSHNLKNKNLLMHADARLREVGIEKSYGKPYGVLLRGLIQFMSSERPIDEFSIEESESIPEFRKRSREFLMDLIRNISSGGEDKILVVSHGACIRFFMEHFADTETFSVTGWDPSAVRIMRNTGHHRFVLRIPEESEKDQRILVEFQKLHDLSHLSKEMLEADSLKRLVGTPEGKCLSGCFQV